MKKKEKNAENKTSVQASMLNRTPCIQHVRIYYLQYYDGGGLGALTYMHIRACVWRARYDDGHNNIILSRQSRSTRLHDALATAPHRHRRRRLIPLLR